MSLNSPPQIPPDAVPGEYGTTLGEMRRLTLWGFTVGIMASLIGLAVAWLGGTLRTDRLVVLAVFPLVIPALMWLGGGYVLLFRVRVREGRVQQVFLGSHVMNDCAVADFLQVTRRTFFGFAVIHFRGGRRMHFLAGGRREVVRLARDLEALVKERGAASMSSPPPLPTL